MSSRKRNFLEQYLISCFHCVESVLIPKIISDKKAVLKFYKSLTGKELDLECPHTFSEKMNWYKLNDHNPLMQQCADKVGARDYIREKGYVHLLNEVYGIYEKTSEIDPQTLPDQCVIKASHGSHMNYIVTNKNVFGWRKAKAMMKTWLHQNIYWGGREWVYKDIPRRIVVEKYLEDETGELRDYKFFCFNGKPCFLQVDAGRYKGQHIRNYYDDNFELLNLHDDVPNNPDLEMNVSKEKMNEMKSIAEDLANPFQFVRVDFYCVNGKIYFGEMTFFHNGGITWFCPEEYDQIFGDKWELVK